MTLIRFFDMQAELAAQRELLAAAAVRVIGAGAFVLGDEVEAFERELAAHLGANGAACVVGVSSGTDALLCALVAQGVVAGDEVITTPLSFISSASTIARLGAVPVFVDIDPETLMPTSAAVEAKVSPKTRAVVAVHLFGAVAPAPLLRPGTDRVRVIEDAAQRLGSPRFGQMATLSFFPTKHLGGAGDGGAVVCQDAEMAARVRRLRQHGAAPKYVHHELGGNFRLDAMQAAFLRVRLADVAQAIVRRQRAAAYYRDALAAIGLGASIAQPANDDHLYQQFVVRIPNRDRVRAALAEAGVETEVYYPVPLHLQPCFAALGYRAGDLPHAERACQELLALPFYAAISTSTQDVVVAALGAATTQRRPIVPRLI